MIRFQLRHFSAILLFQAEVYVNLLEGESVDDDDDDDDDEAPDAKEPEKRLPVPDESDNSSVSTLSTIRSRSSFTSYDAKMNSNHHFDLAKLLDPFERLEREFNWEELTPIRPPSAFSSLVPDHEAKKEDRDDAAKECHGKR